LWTFSLSGARGGSRKMQLCHHTGLINALVLIGLATFRVVGNSQCCNFSWTSMMISALRSFSVNWLLHFYYGGAKQTQKLLRNP
jgi:hypothetical protein